MPFVRPKLLNFQGKFLQYTNLHDPLASSDKQGVWLLIWSQPGRVGQSTCCRLYLHVKTSLLLNLSFLSSSQFHVVLSGEGHLSSDLLSLTSRSSDFLFFPPSTFLLKIRKMEETVMFVIIGHVAGLEINLALGDWQFSVSLEGEVFLFGIRCHPPFSPFSSTEVSSNFPRKSPHWLPSPTLLAEL